MVNNSSKEINECFEDFYNNLYNKKDKFISKKLK